MEDLVIEGVKLDDKQVLIALSRVPDRPGYAALVFGAIAEAGVFVDMIVQNVGIAGDSMLSFTVPRDSASRAVEAVRLHAAANGARMPATLDAVKVVPVPLDPVTGAPFPYARDGETAALSREGPRPSRLKIIYRIDNRG